MKFSEIRKKWLEYFERNNHLIVESKSLVPKNDSSLLWINSGVATLKKYFSGEENPPSRRLVNSQRCIRTNDIYNVGVTSRHHTFFEMLGNFSIGDYFREEAINLAFNFLVNELKLDIEKLYITVYEEDDETYNLWVKLGIYKNHIIKCSKDRNFWEIGQGPCGPCTEIYFDRGAKYDPENIGEKLFFNDIENDRYIEIWNIVFSEFENDGNNNYKPLARKNIDTGAGIERLACILQNVNTNYDIDVFVRPRKVIEQHSIYKYNEDLYFEKNKNKQKELNNKAFIVIIDHFKSCIFAISDGVIPSNKDRGYILRKLLRISFIYLIILKIDKNAIPLIIDEIINTMSDYYPYLIANKQKIYDIFLEEYKSHHESLLKSCKKFVEYWNDNSLTEQKLFNLVDTYGFPLEIIKELENYNDPIIGNKIVLSIASKFKYEIKELKSININFKLFNELFDKHREISKSNLNVNAINKQNENLINLNIDSLFDYDGTSFSQSKILKLFDKDFNEVNEIKNNSGFFVLDKTTFYATSGGQINDVGWVKNVFIKDVIKAPNGQHIHYFENGTFSQNEVVNGEIDTYRRKILTAHHSTEHLLHSALKRIIDNSIKQEGALKSDEKVTFDFFFHRKLTIDEIKLLENDIREEISKNECSELFLVSLEEAQKMGALAYFENVYKKIKGKLRVVKLGKNSIEICGGTHVKKMSEIENFMITKLESKGSGTWRIEAISTNQLVNEFKELVIKDLLEEINKLNNEYIKINIYSKKIDDIFKLDFSKMHYIEMKELFDLIKNEMNIIKHKNQKEIDEKQIVNLKNDLKIKNDYINLIYLNEVDRKILMQALTNLINENKNNIYFVFNKCNNLYQYFIVANEDFLKSKNINFNTYANMINSSLNGKGGGRFNFIQGNINEENDEKISKIIEEIKSNI